MHFSIRYKLGIEIGNVKGVHSAIVKHTAEPWSNILLPRAGILPSIVENNGKDPLRLTHGGKTNSIAPQNSQLEQNVE